MTQPTIGLAPAILMPNTQPNDRSWPITSFAATHAYDRN